MKKFIVYSFTVTLLASFFISCQPKEMETEVINYEKTFYLSSDTSIGRLSFQAETEIPVKFRNKEVLDNVKKQILAKIFGESFTTCSIDSVLPKYAYLLFTEYKKSNEPYLANIAEMKGSTSLLDNEIQIQGVAMYVDDKILSYSYERYAFMGGAEEGNSNRLLYNFDLTNSDIISEKDLFTTNYKEPLTKLIKQQIVEDNAEMESVADLNDFHFFEDKIKPNNNFYVTAEGIVYVYNPYDIAPYSMGQTSVLLTFDKLKPILRQGNPIAYMYETKNS
ncbi:MAG: RsiV family protein [Paludibacteraceae bacterium]